MAQGNALERLRSIATEMQKIDDEAGSGDLTREQERRWRHLQSEADAAERELKRDRVARILRGESPGTVELTQNADVDVPHQRWSGDLLRRPDPWSLDQPSMLGRGVDEVTAEMRGRARTAVELVRHAPDSGRERIAQALDTDGGESLSRLARWTVATSNPDYLRAFSKLASDPQNGHREFTTAELHAFQHVQSEARAMSLTDSAGGYLVPFQLDPTVIITNSGGTNPLREIARQVVATSDVWNGVSSAGVSSSWYAEGAEVTDDSPTLAQPSITIHKQMSWVPISFEAIDDMANATEEVSKLLADEANLTDAEAFQVGTGTGQPVGIVTALTGTASEVNQTGTTLDAADFYAVQEALGPRFQPNASWIMHLVSINRGRSIIAGTGLTTPMIEGNPPMLLGKRVYEASFMDSTVTGSASDYLVVYGDFGNGYVIADRIGTTVELVPHLVGSNRRPTGQRGWLMWRRVGADSVNDNGFRMLDKSA